MATHGICCYEFKQEPSRRSDTNFYLQVGTYCSKMEEIFSQTILLDATSLCLKKRRDRFVCGLCNCNLVVSLEMGPRNTIQKLNIVSLETPLQEAISSSILMEELQRKQNKKNQKLFDESFISQIREDYLVEKKLRV